MRLLLLLLLLMMIEKRRRRIVEVALLGRMPAAAAERRQQTRVMIGHPRCAAKISSRERASKKPGIDENKSTPHSV